MGFVWQCTRDGSYAYTYTNAYTSNVVFNNFLLFIYLFVKSMSISIQTRRPTIPSNALMKQFLLQLYLMGYFQNPRSTNFVAIYVF